MFDQCLNRLVQAARIALLAAVAVLVYRAAELVRTVNGTVAAVPAVVREEVARTRSEALREIRVTRSQLLERVDRIGERTDARVAAIAQDLTAEVAALNRTASWEIESTGASVRRLTDVYAAVPGDFKYATSQIWNCEGNPDCLENRYVSLSRAAERASRAVEQTAPRIAASVERAAENSDRTTAESAVLLKNLAGSFKPLPWWVRFPLQIALPAAQLATPLMVR